jgi:hypothetical protein
MAASIASDLIDAACTFSAGATSRASDLVAPAPVG